MLATTKKLRQAVEEQMLEDGTRMEDAAGDCDLMVGKLYTAEDIIEAEKKMWSGSTGTNCANIAQITQTTRVIPLRSAQQ